MNLQEKVADARRSLQWAHAELNYFCGIHPETPRTTAAINYWSNKIKKYQDVLQGARDMREVQEVIERCHREMCGT